MGVVKRSPGWDDRCVVNYPDDATQEPIGAHQTMPAARTPDSQLVHLDSPDTDPALANAIRRVLGHGHTIDITTLGRRSGQPRRIEIVFHNFGGRLYISGMPSQRTRGWLHNLRAHPELTFHLKQLVTADVPATARANTDPGERLEVLTKVARVWRRDVDPMLRFSPLVEVTIAGYERAEPAVEPLVEVAREA
jgi:deazaflavin-dependent oxidoreductase (nitroreductase family)